MLDPNSSISKWRWAVALLIMLGYVGILGYLGAKQAGPDGISAPLLPNSTWKLLFVCASELLLFGFAFLLFWIFTRANRVDLELSGSNPIRIFRRGFLYSIALRAFIAVMLMLTTVIISLLTHRTPQQLEGLRPRTENLVDFAALINDPFYFAVAVTIVSFGLGGFREELWRTAVFAAFHHLLPPNWRGTFGKVLSVLTAAVVFGLGHLSQGWGGVYITALLGIALGWIIIHHNSLWEAALAHGFFDATSFTMLYMLARYYPDALKLQ